MNKQIKCTRKDFSPGSCFGCECFDDKTFSDASFCRAKRKRKRFPSNKVPRYAPKWCPKRHSLCLKIYAYYFREGVFALENVDKWVHCFTSGTDLQAYQLVNQLQTGDLYNLLGGYYPSDGDIVEMDNGLTTHYVQYKDSRWKKTLLPDMLADRALYGDLQVLFCSNATRHYCSEQTHPKAVIYGYWDGRRIINWRGESENPKVSEEFAQMFSTLESIGLLKDFEELQEFCRRRQSVMCKVDDDDKKFALCCYIYGVYATYYFKIVPDLDELYQVQVLIYDEH